MRQIASGGLLAAAFALAVMCAPASAKSSHLWVVSGSLAGSYTNDVGWVNCQDTGASGMSRESLTLAARISPGRPQPFTTGIGLVLKWAAGGHWSMSGSYPPRQEQPNGDVTCGAQQSFQCSGAIMRHGPARAVIAFLPQGRSLAGNFLENSFFGERREDQDEPCQLAASPVAPLFGLDGTTIEQDALVENDAKRASLTVPRSKFKGRKAFTVTHTAHPDGGCPRIYYSACTETGTITLTLRFKHPH